MSISWYTPFGVPITTEAATSVSGGHISNTIAADCFKSKIRALGQQEYVTNMAAWTSEISSFKKFATSLQKDVKWHDKGSITQVGSRSGSIVYGSIWGSFVYNPDVVREQFTGLVIQEVLSFNHFDNPRMTRVFQNHLQPKYNHCQHTTDVWSAPHGLSGSYLCVTAHWSEPETWQMMKHVTAFEDFPVPHTGVALFKMLKKNIDEFASFDVLGFWKAKESMFPVLSRMVQDILSIQATSVASEFAFSSGRMLSFRRTRLTPTSLEMCMCLKDHLDATDRIQHTSNLKNSLDFEVEILDEEVLASEAISLFDEEIALDEAASEARSNRSGEEYEITSD
ncbi:zinc finger BED domain-containing protein RICESLEEPER 2-like protein [Tanacetum coccineum]